MDTLQALVLIDVYVLLALSLWTSSKGKIRSQLQYLLFALLGQCLFSVIATNVLQTSGIDTIWCSIIYLSLSAAIYAHKFSNLRLSTAVFAQIFSNLPKVRTGFVNSPEVSRGEPEDAKRSDIVYIDIIQKAEDLLKESD